MFLDDRQLVRRFLGGKVDAFGLLYDRHEPRVYNLLRRLTANEASAQDLVQDTFLTAYRSLGDWRGQGALGTWLCGIAFRLYLNAVRKDARHPSEPLEDQEALPTSEGDPFVHLTQRELQDRLDAAIGELPPTYRAAFILVKVEGLSYREASDWLGVPLGTLQSRLWRAVCRLQVLLRDLEPEHGAEEATADAAADDRGRPYPPSYPVPAPAPCDEQRPAPSPRAKPSHTRVPGGTRSCPEETLP